jgi:thiosulfate dehydrogenase
MARGFVFGMLFTLMAGAAGALIFIVAGGMPANADSKPSSLEAWAARSSLRASIGRQAPKGSNHVTLSDENLIDGIKLYEKNCVVCHGAANGKASNIAVGLYQEAPQFAKDGVEDDPEGQIYWKIKHGIRLTGMPSFSKTLKDPQLWKLTLLLKHMDSLTPVAQKVWTNVSSVRDKSNAD